MFEEQELRDLSQQDRLTLMRRLAAIENEDLPRSQDRNRRRAIALFIIIVACVCLAAWTGLLAATLPRYYRTGDWRGAWVGLDIAELATFAATGWALWRRRQIIIICLVVLATLLCCDAWFDVVLDARTAGFELSLLSAIFVELPIAAIAILGARRLLRATIATMRRYQGETGPLPRLRNLPLIGAAEGRPLHHLLSENAENIAAQACSDAANEALKTARH
jgi:hypothetical protein